MLVGMRHWAVLLLEWALVALVVGCGGGSQITATPAPTAKVVAKVSVQPLPTKELPEPERTNSSTPTETAPSATLTPLPSATFTPVPPAQTPTFTPLLASIPLTTSTYTPTAAAAQVFPTATANPTRARALNLGEKSRLHS